MTKMERIKAVLNNQETDRVPFTAYMHSTVHEKTVEKFTQFTLDFYQKYDPDYIKVMYDHSYDMPTIYDFVQTIDIWGQLEEFGPHIGAFGRQIESLKRIKESVGPDVPVIQTIFSPFHIGGRLAFKRILKDYQNDPELVNKGLKTITNNYQRFIDACLTETGIDGFFFGAFGCEKSWMEQKQYQEWIMPLDQQIIKSLRKSEIVILHIHGEKDAYFDLLKDYDCDAISWEDRLAGPSVQDAKSLTDKCLIGGVDHYYALECSPDDIIKQSHEAIQAAKGRGFILGPGCTFFNHTPSENIKALKNAVLTYKKQ
jgi:uroporphyrinogen decarboxylase